MAFILPALEGGGVGRFVLSLCQGFMNNGIQVDLVLARAEGEMIQDIPAGINLIALNSSRSSNFSRKLKLIFSLLPLFRYFRRHNPDVVFPIWYGADIFVILTLRLSSIFKRNTLVVFTVHNVSTLIGSFPSVPRQHLAKVSMWLSLRLADKAVAVSKGVAEDFSKVFHFPLEKFRVIYNPLDIEEILAKAKEPFSHKWYNKGISVILGAGRLEEQKNFRNLIEAFSIVRKEIQAELVILGEGKERKHLEALIEEFGLEDDVDLPGFVANPFPYIKNASVFVLSSDYEGLSMVILEALTLGTPVVSTNCPSGPSEILENGKYGKLVPVGNSKALAESIVETLRNPLPKEFLQERAKDFSLDIAVRKYLDLIECAKKSE
jgi:glycosyltransferase involved in cell wall biosynthesis